MITDIELMGENISGEVLKPVVLDIPLILPEEKNYDEGSDTSEKNDESLPLPKLEKARADYNASIDSGIQHLHKSVLEVKRKFSPDNPIAWVNKLEYDKTGYTNEIKFYAGWLYYYHWLSEGVNHFVWAEESKECKYVLARAEEWLDNNIHKVNSVVSKEAEPGIEALEVFKDVIGRISWTFHSSFCTADIDEITLELAMIKKRLESVNATVPHNERPIVIMYLEGLKLAVEFRSGMYASKMNSDTNDTKEYCEDENVKSADLYEHDPILDYPKELRGADDEVHSELHTPLRSLKEIANEILGIFGPMDWSHEFRLETSESASLKVSRRTSFCSDATTSYCFQLNKSESLQYIMLAAVERHNGIGSHIVDNDITMGCIQDVMKHGVDINEPSNKWLTANDDDITPLSQAAKRGNIDLIKFLLNNGAIVTPPVLRAVFGSICLSNEKQVQIITSFLNSGIDLNMSDDRGGAIHKIGCGYYTVENFMWFLLERGLGPNIVNKEGRTALHYAVKESGYQDLALILIEHGADLYFKDKQNLTPYDLIRSSDQRFKDRALIYYAKYQDKLKAREFVSIQKEISSDFKIGYHLEKDELKEHLKFLYDAFEHKSNEIVGALNSQDIFMLVSRSGGLSIGSAIDAVISGEYQFLSGVLYMKGFGEYIGTLHPVLLASMPFISYLVGYTEVERLEAKKQLATYWNIPESKVYDKEKMSLFDELSYRENSVDGTYDRKIFIKLHEQYIDELLAAKRQESFKENMSSQLLSAVDQSIKVDEEEVSVKAPQPALDAESTHVTQKIKVADSGLSEIENKGVNKNKIIAALKELIGVSDVEADAMVAIGGSGFAIDPVLTVLLSGKYALSGTSIINISTGTVVGALPAALVASMPFIVYLTDQNAVARLEAKKQLAGHFGVPASQVFDKEKIALFDDLASGDNSIDGTYDPRYFNQLYEQYIDSLIAAKQKELSSGNASAKMGSTSAGLEEDDTDTLFKKSHNKGKTEVAKKQQAQAFGGGAPNDPDFDPDDENIKFKKKDGSGRYECESSQSPQWQATKPFKDKYRTNGLKGRDCEYYRFDRGHKDIEIYDDKARFRGSQDPVTGKIYRPGTMRENPQLKRLL